MPILANPPMRGQSLDTGDPLVIGLVNNMPDAALRTTERNFREVLAAASRDIPIHLRMLSLPEISRSAAARLHLAESYEDIGELWDSRIDGLIVTGTEPCTADITGEALWTTLTKLVDWAEYQTSSSIWSCLAAHAAVRYMDGVARRGRVQKLSGVFDCDVAADHAIAAGIECRWRVPHSRWNELSEAELVANGYDLISRSAEAGADMFAKERESLFIFLQGHPEYDSKALFREYRRDVGRYLAGDREDYPEMPRNYFNEAATATLESFRQKALDRRSIDLLDSFPRIPEEQMADSCRSSAVGVYRNWISYLLMQRARSGGRAPTALYQEHSPLAEGVA